VTYAFSGPIEYVLAQLLALDGVHQCQVLAGVHSFLGEDHTDVPAAIAAIAKRGGAAVDDIAIWRYEISADGVVAFEMWTFGGGDDGLVFARGEREPIPVHCSQGHFWSVDDGDADAIALADALEGVAPF
jgi:hypothetical protein